MSILRATLIFALAVMVMAPSRAKADTIFSNLGGTYSGGEVAGDGDGRTYADAFTPAGNYALSEVQLVLTAPSTSDVVDVSLETNNGGIPGTVLESFTFTNITSTGNDLVSANSVLNPILTLGTEYWLVVTSASSDPIGWENNTVGDPGAFDFCQSGCSSWSEFTAPANGQREAFAIDGTPSATPEPAPLVLVGSGAAALLMVARRKLLRGAYSPSF